MYSRCLFSLPTHTHVNATDIRLSSFFYNSTHFNNWREAAAGENSPIYTEWKQKWNFMIKHIFSGCLFLSPKAGLLSPPNTLGSQFPVGRRGLL